MLNRREIGLAAGAAMMTAGWRQAEPAWVKLATEPYRGKQDDVFFIDDRTGWYGNGLGRLFKTVDGGQTWIKQLDRPGTFVRALGFVDDRLGFLGNIGPGSFPNVTDETPLYRTRDGGETWQPISLDGPMKGVCAIDVLKQPFINAGHLDHRVTVRAAGRVGGPAHMATSHDGGETWTCEDLAAQAGAIFDVKFVSPEIGFIAAATDAQVANSHGLILRTGDGGRTWSPVYRSTRPWETIWKLAFPTAAVGYGTLQSYDRDPAVTQRFVVKTTDGGLTWSELPLVDNAAVREFGIGFTDEKRGWVGAMPGGFETRDGGASWQPDSMGAAVNKVRVVDRAGGGKAVFAIGAELHRLDLP